MKTIRIGFSRSTKKFPLFSWLVQLYQGFTPYSHVYIRLESTPHFPSDKILHAAEGQVSHYSLTSFLKRNKIVKEFKIKVTLKEYDYIKKYLFHELAGEPYSIWQNIGIALVSFLHLFNIRIKNPFSKGWNCSEYVATVLKSTNPDLVKGIDPNTVTPKDLYKILERM